MAIIALLILTPLLGFLAPSRRFAFVALIGVWAIVFPFQTHDVLRDADGDLPDELAGTIGYFVVNDAALAAALFTTDLLVRRRIGADGTVETVEAAR